MHNCDNFFCYSLRLFHYLSAFGETCKVSKINGNSGNRYWVFQKSKRLDDIIASYNEIKHKFD